MDGTMLGIILFVVSFVSYRIGKADGLNERRTKKERLIKMSQKIETVLIYQELSKQGWGEGLVIKNLQTEEIVNSEFGGSNPKTEDVHKTIAKMNEQGFYVTGVGGNAINTSSTVVMTRFS